MSEDPKNDELPGNHGQFGEDAATEAFEKLEDHPAADEPAVEGPKQTNAGERS
jgi:hypothetical protein